MASGLRFADATADFENAPVVIVGIPYEGRSSFRSGTRFAPNRIREASYNLENYLMESDSSIVELGVCDIGDIAESTLLDTFADVAQTLSKILDATKFPIFIGGDHIISYATIKTFKSYFKDLVVVWLDAHLDFRDTYLGDKYNHACAARRVYELVGADNILELFVRSAAADELQDAKNLDLHFLPASKNDDEVLEDAKKIVDARNGGVYLSIDMDVIEPAYSPAVSTPEPFGILPSTVKKCIRLLSPKLVGADIVEVCPPFDNGITCMLAAKLILYAICSVGGRFKR